MVFRSEGLEKSHRCIRVRGDGHHGDDDAQVGGEWCLRRENVQAVVVEAEPGAIDLGVIADYGFGEWHVALEERLHGALDLAVDHRAHLEHGLLEGGQLADGDCTTQFINYGPQRQAARGDGIRWRHQIRRRLAAKNSSFCLTAASPLQDPAFVSLNTTLSY